MHQIATNPLNRMIEEGMASAANTQQYFLSRWVLFKVPIVIRVHT